MFRQIVISKDTMTYFKDKGVEFLSLNKTLKLAIQTLDDDIPWERFCIECKTVRSPGGRRLRVDDEVYAFLKGIKERFAQNDVKITFSRAAHILLKTAYENDRLRAVSVNVQGYKAKPSVLDKRLRELTKMMNEELPDLIFLQEMRVGEDLYRLNDLKKRLKIDYEAILPKGFDVDTEYDFCSCVTLIRKSLADKVKMHSIERNHNDTGDSKLRVNYFTVNGMTYINAWMFQTYGASEARKELAGQMWDKIMEEIRKNVGVDTEFYLVGDLNAGEGVAFEDRIEELESRMVNTKLSVERKIPTRGGSVLDHAYCSKFANRVRTVDTTVWDTYGLSDHKALIMRLGRRKAA